MTDPADDDTPPPEEIEMAMEEDNNGRALDGTALERIEALTKRVKYLEGQITQPGHATSEDLAIRRRELAEARRQLADWQTKYEARN